MIQSEKLKDIDPEIEEIIRKELARQQDNLELIASENIVDSCILELQGSILTNKYAEGYPGRRYYGGCQHVDKAELLAIERSKELFKAEYANVQPHSGSQANMAALFALLTPGDKILSMNLAHGGHLTHGSPVSFSGRFFDFCHYGVNPDTGTIDYNEIAETAARHKPKMIIAGASAYPRIIDFKAFSKIAADTDAYLMVDMAHIAGLVSAGLHPSPVEEAHVVTSTTHKTLRGPRGGLILAKTEFGKKLDKEVFPGIQGGPLMHVVAAKATAFKNAMTPSFKIYQKDTVENAKALACNLTEAGFNLVSGGTDNHLVLLDLRTIGITGKDAENILEKAGITANKNPVPFDTRPPGITSGIRLGTPAITSRGMKKTEIALIAQMITDVLKNPDDKLIKQIRDKVTKLCKAFPIYK